MQVLEYRVTEANAGAAAGAVQAQAMAQAMAMNSKVVECAVWCADEAPGEARDVGHGPPLRPIMTLGELSDFDRFLADVERRALRIAEIGVRNRDDALDIVQDAMLRLTRRYSSRPAQEWTPLFYRILNNGVRDWHRRNAVRRRVMVFIGRSPDDEPGYDPVAEAADPDGRTPDDTLAAEQAMDVLERALRRLPARQREAFMLRTFEGLDTGGTARAMGVTAGSVKTHYFRALQTLREALGGHWQ